MVEKEKINILTRGGVYLAKLNPAKTSEIGKVRPVVVLTSQTLLDVIPPLVFICPLSSQSYPEYKSLHLELAARDGLSVKSYALVEHCRAISMSRLIFPRIAQLTITEIEIILHRLNIMLE
jgi:mRNA interferase MazF